MGPSAKWEKTYRKDHTPYDPIYMIISEKAKLVTIIKGRSVVAGIRRVKGLVLGLQGTFQGDKTLLLFWNTISKTH